tara:strand:+ start:4854 stop:5774 length:921 start_codon:yes stop_codon:yes gene_type:complete
LKKIASFTRSSLEIGNGHLVRMSQLISCLNTTDINVDFYCEYEQTPKWFLSVEHTKLAAKDFFEKDLSNYDLIIYDSYLDREKLKLIKNNILLIDDFAYHGQFGFVKNILDYNYGTNKEKYTNKNLFLGAKYFPIGEETYPEYIERKNFNINSNNILISIGGVSDDKLINIDNLLKQVSKFGKIFLMDPLSKLKNYESSKIKVVQNKSLSSIMNKEEFKFGIFAGGTSKYIASAFCLPSFFIGRNELERILINEFEKDNLSINLKNEMKNFDTKNLDEKLFECNKKMNELLDDNNSTRINEAIKNL